MRQNPHFTSWDDRAILSMVEYGMGVSVLSRLMLRGLSQNVVTLPLSDPALPQTIGVAHRSAESPSFAPGRRSPRSALEFRKEEE